MISAHCNKDNMRKYVALLREPGRKQTFGRLRIVVNGDVYICGEGGACEAAIADGVRLRVTEYGNGYHAPGAEYEYFSELPACVRDWLDIDSPSGSILVKFPGEDERGSSVPNLNDTLGWDLALIADAVEYTYLPEDYAARINKENDK